MAQQVDLAKLVVKMEAQADKYLRDLKKQRAETSKWRKRTQKDVSAVQKAFRGLAVGAVLAASVAGMRRMMTESVNLSREIRKGAQVAGMSTEAFQAHAYAAERTGIQMDKFADQMKDVRERVGDFIATGGGPMADFFENVAPKIGITAQELQNLSGPQILQAVKNAMDDANVSMEEQIFYLESLASDTTNLIPLLENGGKKLNEITKEFDDLNVAISETELEELKEIERLTQNLDSEFSKLKTTLVTEFGPGLVSAFSTMRTAVSNLVGVIKWGYDEVSSTINGPAADDIVRLRDKIKTLKSALSDNGLWSSIQQLRLGGLGLVRSATREELEAELARYEAMLKYAMEKSGPKKPRTITITNGYGSGNEPDRSAFDSLMQGLYTEEEAFAASYLRREQIIKDSLKRQAISDEEAAVARKRMQAEVVDFVAKKENDLLKAKMAVASATLDVGIALAKEDSGIQRGLMAVKAGIALKEAMMNMQVAMSEALATPWPGNIAAIAKVATIGGNIVSTLQGMDTSVPSFLGGGVAPDKPRSGGPDGKGGMWSLLHGSEIIFDPKGDKRFNQRLLGKLLSSVDFGNHSFLGGGMASGKPVSATPDLSGIQSVMQAAPVKSESDSGGIKNIVTHNYGSDKVEYMTRGETLEIIIGEMSNQNSRSRAGLHATSNVVPRGSM